MVMSPSQARDPSFTQYLHWKVGKFYADADGFIEYLIFAVRWLGRMEIGNPSMIKLTFEVWHLKQLCQGESDIDAIFVLMVAVSAASVTCVEVSISAAGCDGQYRHYRHRFRGYQDSWPGSDKIRPGPGDTRYGAMLDSFDKNWGTSWPTCPLASHWQCPPSLSGACL